MKSEVRSEKRRFSVFKVLGLSSSPFTVHLSQNFFLCFLSASLLILSHPPYNLWFFAWIALVPLFFVIEEKSFWQCFRWGYLAGLIYFFGMFWWFIHVTLPGMILLNMFLALYFAFFTATYSLIPKRNLGLKVFLAACVWVTFEFMRAHFLSGFGWAALGHTQYRQIWLIQLASLTGVFGVSFFLVVINQFIFFVLRYWHERKQRRVQFGFFYIIVIILWGSIFLYGFHHVLMTFQDQRPPLKVAVVQPNIAQEDKWNPFKRVEIMGRLTDLTKRAAKRDPDLIVWPESSLPATPSMMPQQIARVHALARRLNKPILLGYVREAQGKYFNTAGLISADGTSLGEYDKLHLVPFGEYIPLRRYLPFLSAIIPIEDISSGEKPVVFTLKNRKGQYHFSVLICFEDTVSHVARKLVNAGAQILVNITNDAWFKDTKAPWLHLEAAVFQAVSYQRPLACSANTGVSALISNIGDVQQILFGEGHRAAFRSGVKIFNVQPDSHKTFYLKFGDIFAYLCIACLFGSVIINIIYIKI